MYCPNCGQQQPDNMKFCNNCGTALYATQTPQQPVQNQPAAYNPTSTTSPPAYQTPPAAPNPSPKKPWYKKWWIWVIAGVVSVGIFGAAFGEKTDSSSSSGTSSSGSSSSVSSVTKTEKETEGEKKETKEEKKETEAPATEDPETVKEDFINSCKTVDYKTLSRNPDNYKGDNLKYTGQVIQVVESTSIFNDSTTLRVNVTSEENEFAEGGLLWSDTIICTVKIPEGGDRILEDDIIDLYGVCDGLYTYTTVLGDKESVPKIDIEYYSIHK